MHDSKTCARDAELPTANTDLAIRQQTLQTMKSWMHPHCIVCGGQSPSGLHLEFKVHDDGSVMTRFDCSDSIQGYPQVVHGGIVTSLLDGAMTHCLFAQGVAAVTAEIRVRFLRPVVTAEPVIITARCVRAARRLYALTAELVQAGNVAASATAKFLPRLVAK